ncbi:MAG: MBL fold metallo-hydrolase [Candidatus Thermoplasmatota archaeon]|nr:MBL fold metallo-hydrolase [Candidatus Thermoplasmatota archaeon]
MSMQITHLGSGSRGNATLLSYGDTRVLIDCGFSFNQTENRLGVIGVEPSSIDAIVVTHHHKDHSGSAIRASTAWNASLHCNIGTANRLGWSPVEDCNTFESLERVEFNEVLSMIAIPIPHDDSDNVAIIASDGEGGRAGIVTDLGEGTSELLRHLAGCSHISIEANYDHSRLMEGPYPNSLKKRISGRGGHLSNAQTSEILQRVCHENLESVVLCHLSEKNNAPHLAESEVLMAVGDSFKGSISISRQTGPEFSNRIGRAEPQRVATF